jgi:Uma2 family endonuclease
MSTVVGPQPTPTPVDLEDPWRYGWRYVRREGPDGQIKMEREPLRQEDLLYPQEDDFIVNNPLHDEICTYLRGALFQHLAGRPGAVLLHDCRVDWGVAGVQPLGPDFSIFDNVHSQWDKSQGTFQVAALGARPLLVVEVTSPTTRDVDLDEKVDLYFRANIPFYAIVDPRPHAEGGREVRLIGHRLDPGNRQGYFRARLDDRSRLWLETIGLWLAAEGEHVACFNEGGKRLIDLPEALQANEVLAIRAETAEARVKDLEAELQRLRGEAKGGPPNPAAP